MGQFPLVPRVASRNLARRGDASRAGQTGALANKKVVAIIAIRGSKPGGRGGPVQVRAQVLRDLQASADSRAIPGFALMPDDTSTPEGGAAQAQASWDQADVTRAISAAEEAGLSHYRVEIGPDGTVTIVVGAAPAAPKEPGTGP